MRLTNLTSGNNFALREISKKVHGHKDKRHSRLPAISQAHGGVRYNNADLNEKSNKKLHRKNDSKTTINIMNVTFNSRPGVKDYITHLVGTGTTDGVEEVGLPN